MDGVRTERPGTRRLPACLCCPYAIVALMRSNLDRQGAMADVETKMAALEAISLKVMLNLTEMRQESEASINSIGAEVIVAGETTRGMAR